MTYNLVLNIDHFTVACLLSCLSSCKMVYCGKNVFFNVTYFLSLSGCFDINEHLQSKTETELYYFIQMRDTLIWKLVSE